MGEDTGEDSIVLEVGELRDIKYEEVGKFRTSVLYEAYKEANSITKEIIEDNKRFQAKRGKKASGTEIRNLEQIYNIIFFTGNRGTGKTSSMLSYMEFLKDYYRISNGVREGSEIKEFLLTEGKEDYMFTGLEYIDASSLADKEDILGSVLSKMMTKWRDEEERSYNDNGIRKNEDYAYKKRQICMRFSKVYEHLKNLRSESDITEADNDAFMETLEKLSLTWNLQRAFQELVMDYLDIMEYPGAEKKIGRDNHFLVISIDDLDMNIKHGFQLLEQIRKYFMGPNIIVLMSANYEQLEKICNNHYFTEFEKMRNFGDTEEYVLSLSREYLEKIVPPQRQIVLQSGIKWRFFNGKKVEVKYCGQTSSMSGTLEEIVRDDMKRYFGAGFTLDRKCLYYLTPDTMRELCTWIIRTRRLSEAAKNQEDHEKNYQWFWNEEFPLLCKRYLNTNDDRVFRTADLLEPMGQIRLMKESLKKEGIIAADCANQSLLEILEILSQGTMREQTLASMISIYFTMKLAEIVTSMRWLEGEKKEKASQRFFQHFSGGMWGEWEQKMILPVRSEEGNETVFSPIGYYTFKKQSGFLNTLLKESRDKPIDFLDANKEALINYQLVLLFYQLAVGEGGQEQDMWRLDKENQLVLEGEYRGLFCLSNPFINLMDEACLAHKFVDALPDILCKGKYKQMKAKCVERVKQSISIFKDDKMTEPLIPLDSVDFLVETGKEIQAKLGTGKIEPKKEEVLQAKIQEFFSIIEKYLEKYDKEQAEKYKAHPLVKKISLKDQDFFHMLCESILISTSSLPMKTEEDWSKI